MPLFSVVIPVFNRAHIVQRAIDSVLNQTFSDFELLIVDDGSTDNSSEIVLKNQDTRLKYLYQENQGVCAARNHGASCATGDFLVFLDSDDFVISTWLEEFAILLSKKAVKLVFCDVEMLNVRTQKKLLYKASNPYQETNNKTSDGLYLTGAFCIQKEYFKELGGYDTKIKFGENTELRFRVIRKMPEISFTNKIGLIYEMSNEGSQNPGNKIASIHYLMKKHVWFFKKYPHALRLYLQNLGIAYFRLNEYSKARLYLFKAFLVQPWKLMTFIRLMVSLIPSFAKRLWN